jgi:hypothetical protein
MQPLIRKLRLWYRLAAGNRVNPGLALQSTGWWLRKRVLIDPLHKYRETLEVDVAGFVLNR